MFRFLAYVIIGWLLIAALGAAAHVFGLTVMLPSSSAVLVAHAAFSGGSTAPIGLAVAICLGYLEDLHFGAPVGTLSLAHGLAFLVMHWAAGRVDLRGWGMRAVACTFATAVIDLATWAILMALADALGARREALTVALLDVKWHAFATLLVAPPLWGGMSALFRVLRLRPAPTGPWGRE